MRSVIFIILLATWPLLTVAQVSPTPPVLKKYDQEAIYLKESFWRNYYVKGARQYPVGIGYRKLRQVLEVSPLALNEFKSFRRARRTNVILATLGAIGWAAVPWLTSEDNNEEIAVVSFAGGTALLIAAIPFHFKAKNRLAKSVWLHNRNVVGRP